MTDEKIISDDEQKKINEKIVGQWKRTGVLLAEIRAKELQEFVYDYELVDAMLELGLLQASLRTTSGLVDMQRYFRKWREQNAA
jgi:hypothetical protein